MSKNYRRCVGIVLVNNDKKVLLCERADIAGQWQFPQGGVENGETVLEAAYRELKEETSVVSVELVGYSEEAFAYDFPNEVAKRLKRDGQAISWVFLKFCGQESEINLDTVNREFINWRWADMKDAVDNIADFKRLVYEKAAMQFERVVK